MEILLYQNKVVPKQNSSKTFISAEDLGFQCWGENINFGDELSSRENI